MKKLPAPAFDAAEVYNACVRDLPRTHRTEPYVAAAAAIQTQAESYRLNAVQHSLYALPASERGNDQQVVAGGLTKGDLVTLYTSGMLNGPSGRVVYDKIRASAPLSKCPYCRFGHVETLDHFLPKAFYPAFSILPSNLIPSCISCNSGKSGGELVATEEMSHPYFEEPEIERDIWLVADIVETNPATAKFSVVIPATWPTDLGRRVVNYFSQLELSGRFSVEAASELTSVSAYLRYLPSSNARLEHLQRVAALERRLATNGWKAALYAALAASNWYRDEGYSLDGLS